MSHPLDLALSLPRRPARAPARALVAALGVLLAVALIAELAETLQGVALEVGPNEENRFMQAINEARAASGLGPLAPDGQLIENGRAHARVMAGQRTIFHNTQLAAQITGNWQTLGENVGVGPDVPQLHTAFMNSPSHRANILGPYDRMGVGVILAGGSTIYVTQVFWRTRGQAPQAAPPPPASAGAPAAEAAVSAASPRCRIVRRRRRCTYTRRVRRRVGPSRSPVRRSRRR